MRLLFLALVFISCSAAKAPSGNLNKFQAEFLNEVNKLRRSGCKCGNTYMPPAPPLVWNQYLAISAFDHARDMSQRKYFNHVSLSGKTIKNRMEEAGYTLSGMRAFAFGENIAAGQQSIKDVMNAWIRSEGHCKNIMNSRFREVGLAEFNLHWVQDFGMRIAAE